MENLSKLISDILKIKKKKIKSISKTKNNKNIQIIKDNLDIKINHFQATLSVCYVFDKENHNNNRKLVLPLNGYEVTGHPLTVMVNENYFKSILVFGCDYFVFPELDFAYYFDGLVVNRNNYKDNTFNKVYFNLSEEFLLNNIKKTNVESYLSWKEKYSNSEIFDIKFVTGIANK